MTERAFRAVAGLVLVWAMAAAAVDANPLAAAVTGTVTTRRGAVVLADVRVSVLPPNEEQPLASTTTDTAGRFTIAPVPPGAYRLRAVLEGFQPAERTVIVPADVSIDVSLDLVLSVAAAVDAVDAARPEGLRSAIDGRLFDVAPVRGDTFHDLLPLLPGVVRSLDGRLVANGGRPPETGLSVDGMSVTDPVMGEVGISLPLDAIAAVESVASPYAAEYGRFTVGLTRVITRAGGDRWRASASNFIPAPCAKLCASEIWGVRNFSPRVSVSGPIVPGRLTVAHSLQYHYKHQRVPGLPLAESDTILEGLDSLTRFDASFRAHVLTTVVGVFPQDLQYLGLDTFHPRPVTPNLTRRGARVSVSDAWRLGPTVVLESTVSRTWQRLVVEPSHFGLMVLSPSGTEQQFFSRTRRESTATAWTEALTFVTSGAGEHVIKSGVDVLATSFDGTSETAPVEVRDAAGFLRERHVFGGPVALDADAVDVAVFVDDRWRLSDRVAIGLGARFDRDGVTGAADGSPRAQVTLGLDRSGRTLLRAGAGRFISRTPLFATVFESLDAPTISRFAADSNLAGAQVLDVRHVTAGAMRPERARVWNVGLDRRVSQTMNVRFSLLGRDGRRALVVDAIENGDEAVIALSSTGRSRYREAEATWRYAAASGRELSVSYVRSKAEADFNAFAAYYGAIRRPIVRSNAYAPTTTDAPNRLVAFGVLPFGAWRVSPLFEVRSGFPYSAVDANQQFVGPRNGLRFPTVRSLDLTVSRAVRVAGRQLRLGLRANHVLGNDVPQDVYDNIASPLFGTFTNSIYRRLAVTVAFDR